MNEKMKPHIIAAVAFVVFIVLGLACASGPDSNRLDKKVPLEKSCTVTLGGGEGDWDKAVSEWKIIITRFGYFGPSEPKKQYNLLDPSINITHIVPAGKCVLVAGTKVLDIKTGTTSTYSRDSGNIRYYYTSEDYYRKQIDNITGYFDFEPGKWYNITTAHIPVTQTSNTSIFTDIDGNRYTNKSDQIHLLGNVWFLWKLVVNEIDETSGAIIKNIPYDPASEFYNNGNGFRRIKEYDIAIEYYNKAILLNPNFHGAFNNRGSAYESKKDYDKAIADFSEAIRLKPSALYYRNRGIAYFNKEDYDNAIADYEAALKIDRKDESSKKLLKKAEEKKKQKSK